MDISEYTKKILGDMSLNFINMDESDDEDEKSSQSSDESEEETKIPFWSENPNVLFHKDYILEFFPIEDMTYNQKLNAVTRTVLLLTLLGFFVSRNLRLLVVTIITLFAIFILHHYHKKEQKKTKSKKIALEKDEKQKENFENAGLAYIKEKNGKLPDNVFTEPDSNNPFSNVLMSDYDYNPQKKPAPPAFNANINTQILTQAKKLVSEANPDQPDISDKLFKDLGEQLVFEQSLRPFSSNPSTTIPNDQAAFAEFCYGSMISCKEGNQFACARNHSRHTN